MEKQKYYLVTAEALPEVFLRVAEAKRMLQVGEATTVGEAAKLAPKRIEIPGHIEHRASTSR